MPKEIKIQIFKKIATSVLRAEEQKRENLNHSNEILRKNGE